MKIVKVTKVGKKPVYDLSVKDVEHYVLENGAVTHNTGIMYSADTVFIIGRRQIKEGTEIKGYEFVLNVEKSRYVKEKSKLPISVTFDGGINMYSGLLDLALELGYTIKPKAGWYQPCFLNEETGELEPDDTKSWRAKDTECLDYWKRLFMHEPFKNAVTERYKLGAIELDQESLDAEVAELI